MIEASHIPEAASPKTLLILNDDADGRFLAVHALRKGLPHVEIVEAGTVEHALAHAAAIPLDIVITDHHLGTETGIEFIGRLKALNVQCPVVMLTGSEDPVVHRRALAAGAVRVIVNSQTDFVEEIRAVLEG